MSEAASSRAVPRLRALVIEDHPVGRRVAMSLLARVGFDVASAASGAAGLGMAVSTEPSLILLDMRLPDMTGPEVARQLRLTTLHRSTPILALSSDTGDSARAASRAAGMDGYLEKPVEPERLYAVLAVLMPCTAMIEPRTGRAPWLAPPRRWLPADCDGIDEASGLQFFGGDRDAYRTALACFATMYRHGLPGRLGASAMELQVTGDANHAKSVVAAGSVMPANAAKEALHALEGACAAIGANELAREVSDAGRRIAKSPNGWDQADVVRIDRALVALAARLRRALSG